MNSMETLRKHKKQINSISEKYHAHQIRVFGSVARGNNTDNSDIDFLVSFSPEASLMDQVGITDELSKLLQCHVDVVSERGLNPLISEQVLKEAISI